MNSTYKVYEICSSLNRATNYDFADSPKQKHTNQERCDYVQAIVEELGLNKNVVFMGHSRGTENTVRLAARNADRCVGALLVNPIGLRPHRGVRPISVVYALSFLWSLGPIAQSFLRPFFHWCPLVSFFML